MQAAVAGSPHGFRIGPIDFGPDDSEGGMMAAMDELFADLRTLEDIRRFVDERYHRAGSGPRHLPATGDEPGPLMAHAVKVAGAGGLTRAELEHLFTSLGQARFARGLAALQRTEGIVQVREPRPNAGGLYQWQVVFRRR